MEQSLELLGSVPSRTWRTFLSALSPRSLLPDPAQSPHGAAKGAVPGSDKGGGGGQNGAADAGEADFDIDPEAMSNQKRAWQALQKEADAAPMPDVLLEHFLVLGVHPGADLRAVEEAFVRDQEAELAGEAGGAPQTECYMEPQVRVWWGHHFPSFLDKKSH